MTTSDKLDRFQELLPGWHFGRGVSPEAITVVQARLVLTYLQDTGVVETDAFCGPDGEIMVTGYPDGHYIEIDLGHESMAAVRHEDAAGRVVEEAILPIDEVAAFVSRAAQGSVSETCPSSDSSTPQAGTAIGTNSTITLSRIIQERTALPSLIWTAPSRNQVEYALISKNITGASVERPPRSGHSSYLRSRTVRKLPSVASRAIPMAATRAIRMLRGQAVVISGVPSKAGALVT